MPKCGPGHKKGDQHETRSGPAYVEINDKFRKVDNQIANVVIPPSNFYNFLAIILVIK